MKTFRLIFAISLSVLFVVSALVAMFNAGSVINAALNAYVFEVEEEYCDERKVPVAEGETPLVEVGDSQVEEECGVDYNGAKRDIAGGIAYLIVSAPVAYISFRKSQTLFKGE